MSSARSFLAVSLLATLPALGQSSAEERDGTLFVFLTAMVNDRSICEARIPNFRNRFAPAFEKWRQKNRAAFERGEAFLRASAAANGMNLDSQMADNKDAQIKLLKGLSQSVLEENCNAMLKIVEAS